MLGDFLIRIMMMSTMNIGRFNEDLKSGLIKLDSRYIYLGKDEAINFGLDFKDNEGYLLKFVVSSFIENKCLCFKFNKESKIVALNEQDIQFFKELINLIKGKEE